MRPKLVIGFAAETQDVEANAKLKLERKGADLIVANDVSPATGIMGGTRNRVKTHPPRRHRAMAGSFEGRGCGNGWRR